MEGMNVRWMTSSFFVDYGHIHFSVNRAEAQDLAHRLLQAISEQDYTNLSPAVQPGGKKMTREKKECRRKVRQAMDKPTKLPWILLDSDTNLHSPDIAVGIGVDNEIGPYHIADVWNDTHGKPGIANARLIVTAVNHHQQLVEALRKARAVAASPQSFDLEGVEADFRTLLATIDKEAQ